MHIASAAQWARAEEEGTYAPESLAREGFVHCSTRAQVAGTLARHFEGKTDLVLLILDEAVLGPALRWERPIGGGYADGEHFPHVYSAIPTSAVRAVEPLAW